MDERERERDGGDDDDDDEEDEAKMGVHFPNKWAWLWYSITWRKGTKEGPNYIELGEGEAPNSVSSNVGILLFVKNDNGNYKLH